MRPISRYRLCLPAACLLLASLVLAQPAPVATPKAPAPTPKVPASTLADPAAYLALQFGPSFKLDPKIPPMFGDLDGDGKEDIVLVGTSATPLMAQEKFSFKVEDPYDAYFGTGNPKITSQFTLHFDGSSRCILIVFDWRQPTNTKAKKVSKFVLINTPFESVSIVNLRLKKKNIQAIDAIDRTTLHALLAWNGKRWLWLAQGMAGDDTLFKMPSQD